MKNQKILIIGRQGVGKTLFANIISKEFDIPVFDGVANLNELTDKEGIYVSNSIPIESAQTGLPKGFVLIYIH